MDISQCIRGIATNVYVTSANSKLALSGQ